MIVKCTPEGAWWSGGQALRQTRKVCCQYVAQMYMAYVPAGKVWPTNVLHTHTVQNPYHDADVCMHSLDVIKWAWPSTYFIAF